MKANLTLIGNIGNIEMKHTKAGDMFMILGVASNEKTKDGEKKTTWFNCMFFKKSAEIIEKYAVKGQPIYIEGMPTASAWQSKDGETKVQLGCFVREFQLLGERKKDASQGAKEVIDNVNNQNVNNYKTSKPQEQFDYDDIPF